MHGMQTLVFCGCLIYAAVDDLKTRTVSDIVCIIIALAGLAPSAPPLFSERYLPCCRFISVQVLA